MSVQGEADDGADDNGLHAGYSCSFDDEKKLLNDYVRSCAQEDRDGIADLEQFESCVLVKNGNRAIVHANVAVREMFANGHTVIGTSTDGLVGEQTRRISQMTDELVLSGVEQLEFDHPFRDAQNRLFHLQIYKRRLDELSDPSYSILVLIRATRLEAEAVSERRMSLSQQLLKFRALDDTDQRICRLYHQGESTKAISQEVGLATRSVELHRQKIMDTFGFDKPVEIIKLLTRLEEHNLIRQER